MPRLTRHVLSAPLEALEARIAPAVTIVNASTATYSDIDGDVVTVRVSSGTLTEGLFTTVASGEGHILQRLNLTGGGFANSDVSITVRKVGLGDGLVNVGFIDSTGHDLRNVTVQGDLGRIVAGDGDPDPERPPIPALNTLTVRSMGRMNTETQAAGGNLNSTLSGALVKLIVRGDIVDARIVAAGSATGRIGAISVGGSLVRGAIVASAGGGFTRGIGIGPIRIAGDVQGGTTFESGVIRSAGKIGAIQIGGSVIGGTGSSTGMIQSGSGTDSISIGGNLTGGSIAGTTTTLDRSGYIEVGGRVKSISIGGSIISGTDTSTAGSLTRNASVRVGEAFSFNALDNGVASFNVRGSLIGNRHANGDSPVILSFMGLLDTSGQNIAAGKITIGRRVEHALILGGYDINLVPRNPDASIGSVRVGGDWVASSLAVGVVDGGNGFGNSNDEKIVGGGGADTERLIARIGSIAIRGEAYGTPNVLSSVDHYGIVAQQIGSLKVGGKKFPLASGAANDLDGLAIGPTGDFRVREVSL